MRAGDDTTLAGDAHRLPGASNEGGGGGVFPVCVECLFNWGDGATERGTGGWETPR